MLNQCAGVATPGPGLQKPFPLHVLGITNGGICLRIVLLMAEKTSEVTMAEMIRRGDLFWYLDVSEKLKIQLAALVACGAGAFFRSGVWGLAGRKLRRRLWGSATDGFVKAGTCVETNSKNLIPNDPQMITFARLF